MLFEIADHNTREESEREKEQDNGKGKKGAGAVRGLQDDRSK